MSLKWQCEWNEEGHYYEMNQGVKIPVRLFLSPKLFEESEEEVYRQIVNATEFPGVQEVVITPDVHTGYVVPVGCVMATNGTLCQAPVGFDIGCFTADTLVPLVDGKSYPMSELAARNEDFYVYAVTPTQKITAAKATAKKTRSDASLVIVTLDNSREIICTPDHEFMLRDGSYQQAQYLTPQTSLMPFYSAKDRDGYITVQQPVACYNHKVVSVESLTYTADVYCLTVPEYGNFALDAGVFVHNCGMLAFKSSVSKGKGFEEKLRQRFSERVMEAVGMGAGKGSGNNYTEKKFEEIVRHGANALHIHRENSERDALPVSDTWDIPKVPFKRGIGQLGSLGGGNHFIEIQHDQNDHLWVMVHTGSRGFGHGLATYFIEEGKNYLKQKGIDVRGGAEAVYFEPDNPLYEGYKNAVAAGGNFAIANRLLIWEVVGNVFEKVFGQEPELVYEISHNLAQEEDVPSLGGKSWVHRKGATRAFPAGHPMLAGTKWETTGHPILIPGSMGDNSYILYAEPGAAKSLYSVNHGCGRRLSRAAAKRQFTQRDVNEQMKKLNVMVNAGGNVPIDESPGCYKPAKEVIGAVVKAGLARIAYTLTPIASLKGVD